VHEVVSETRQGADYAWAGLGPADRASWAQVILQARCADAHLDADEWFPVSAQPESARREAAAAIAVCAACPVRAQCLMLSLRHWGIGQHGIWGGLVPAERAALRRQRLAS
jgi:Transcription factor WhiB